MSKPIIIGLTGGIGSGKSLIAKILHARGIPVYNSDYWAKRLYEIYPDLLKRVTQRFGTSILGSSGELDRQALAEIVFNDDKALADLNKLVHPLVKEHFDSWADQHLNHPFIFKEAAILLESGSYVSCDQLWLVTAPQEIRERRVMDRDLISRELVQQRMNKQWTDEKKRSYSHAELINDGESLLIPQIMDLLDRLSAEQAE